jgi:diacylglycerol kinase (ATP)
MIPFIINLRSRKAGRWPQVAARLAALGVPVEPLPVADPRQIEAHVRERAAFRAPAIILGGGDGTISRAIGPLLGSGIPLGLVPLGTGNGIPRSFGIFTAEDCCEAIAAGKVATVDVGRANHSYFLNLVSIGMSVEVSRRLRAPLKQVAGYGAYPLSIVRAALGRSPFTVQMTAGSTQSTRSTWSTDRVLRSVQVLVAAGAYQSRWPAPGLIRPDGALHAYVLRPGSLPALFLTVLGFWSGLPARGPWMRQLVVQDARRLSITTAPALPVNVDGEIVERTPLEVELLPAALRLFVPGPAQLRAVAPRAG